ncbi:MAG: hypothetical protein JNK48_12175 [Bryobacterales bacterium]|nr:hypothetical protein [Bryobacterales bacterium]
MRATLFLVSLLFPSTAWCGPAQDLARDLLNSSLDPSACYRVRNLRFARDEIRLYFTEGFLIFGKPVNGTRVSAVFSADVEGGDGELLLMPPSPSERRSLASFARTPNLNEHFGNAVLVFTDDSAEELLSMAREAGAAPSAEMGNLLAGKWTQVAASFLASFEVRLVEDLLAPNRKDRGFFFAAMSGKTLGNFDIIHDPRRSHQINVGQVAFREERRFFDVWTNFEARSWRSGLKQPQDRDFQIENVAIDASIESDLNMKAVSRLRLIPRQTLRSIGLELSQQMRISEVKINGAPGDAFYPESLRANLLRNVDNLLVLFTGEKEFPAGQPVDLEIRYEGKVIAQAGDGVYYVGSRGVWYPNRRVQFSNYDVTFRFPKHLDLVATGELVEEREEGEWKISRRKTHSPVRLFGFNLGDYERKKITRSGTVIEVCANRKVEAALQPKPRPVELPQATAGPFPRTGRRNTPPSDVMMMPVPPPNPAARLEQLAAEFASAFDEMALRFGKPNIRTLTVSPIPGRFGQGFPGLVYLSTMSYLEEADRPLPRGSEMQQTFFSEILHAHEIAHQWWGNGVTAAEYQDDWLMEALANYTALWILEKKKGSRSLDWILDLYREDLLRKQEDGRTVESAGPVTMGYRLHSSQYPTSWPVITYEKGTWILHMLRKRLGDAAFQKMLAQFYQRNALQPVTTAQFQKVAAEFLPPQSPDPKLESFFDQWVHGTGIPTLKLTWTTTGRAPKLRWKATVTQSDVDENFTAWVPIEIQLPRQKPIVKWVQTAAEPVTIEAVLTAPPVKVTLDPGNATLARK